MRAAAVAAVGNGDQTRAFRSSFSLSAVCTRLLFNTSAGLVHTNTHLLCTSTHTHAHAHPQLRPVVVVTLSGDVGVESDFGETTQRASTILITLLFASSSTYFTFLFPFVSFLIFCAVSSCTSSFFFFFSIHRRVKPDGMMMILLISITILFLCFFFFVLPQSISSPAQTVNILLDLLLCWSTRNLV